MSNQFLIFDFETLSNIPLQAPIISLGAVSGNFGDSISDLRETGFYCNIKTKEQTDLGLQPNKETVKWWFSQGPEAQAVLNAKDKISVSDALQNFATWCKSVGVDKNTKTFIRAPHFDMTIYENILFKLYGKIDYPFNHWKIRDTRTAIDIMYDVDNGYAPNAKELIKEAGLVEHNAIDDCLKDYLQLNQYYEAIKG